MRQGVILAPTIELGEEARKSLGLKYWLIVTPHRLDRFSSLLAGITCEPRVVIVDHAAHTPASEALIRHPEKLVALCGGRKPDVWHLRRS